jgi:aminopeptidase N
LNHGNHFAYSRELAIRRSLKNLALSYLASLGDSDSQDLLRQQWQSAKNMTDMQASLGLMVDHGHPDRDSALISFYEKWKHEALVIDQWFRLQALSSAEDTSKRVLRLAKHPGFVLSNPNRVRSLLVAFCKNIIRFHDQNGEGYQFYGDNVLALDRLNPQMAARLARSLSDWHRYDQSRQKMMVAQLVRIREEKNLSNDVREIVGSLLK